MAHLIDYYKPILNVFWFILGMFKLIPLPFKVQVMVLSFWFLCDNFLNLWSEKVKKWKSEKVKFFWTLSSVYRKQLMWKAGLAIVDLYTGEVR